MRVRVFILCVFKLKSSPQIHNWIARGRGNDSIFGIYSTRTTTNMKIEQNCIFCFVLEKIYLEMLASIMWWWVIMFICMQLFYCRKAFIEFEHIISNGCIIDNNKLEHTNISNILLLNKCLLLKLYKSQHVSSTLTILFIQ